MRSRAAAIGLAAGLLLPGTVHADPAPVAALKPLGPDARSGGPGRFLRAGSPLPEDRLGRVGSTRYITWIYSRPDVRSKKLGYVRTGTSVPLRRAGRVDGWGKCHGFYAVAPRGYVCNDDSATTDLSHPVLQASKYVRPDASVRPYRYALSLGAPMYNRIPTSSQHERVMKRHPLPDELVAWAKKYEGLATQAPIPAADRMPEFLENGRSVPTPFTNRPALVRKTIPQGSVLAYTRAFQANGKTWLLSTDLTVVPASHMRPFRPSPFRGVWLKKESVRLPIAWMRSSPKPKYQESAKGFVATGQHWPKLGWVALTGERRRKDGVTYLATRESGHWIAARDATVVTRQKRPRYVGANDQWIVVAVTNGTLTAYQGDRAEFSTLMSPGSGGVQPKGGDPVALSTTPLGSYRVTWKDKAAGMSPDDGDPTTFWISDVPWTMYFQPPFAIHAAFWHDEFGQPKSGGCVNVSPTDARALFDWAGPDLPSGWQGAAHGGPNGVGTHVIVLP